MIRHFYWHFTYTHDNNVTKAVPLELLSFSLSGYWLKSPELQHISRYNPLPPRPPQCLHLGMQLLPAIFESLVKKTSIDRFIQTDRTACFISCITSMQIPAAFYQNHAMLKQAFLASVVHFPVLPLVISKFANEKFRKMGSWDKRNWPYQSWSERANFSVTQLKSKIVMNPRDKATFTYSQNGNSVQ